MIYNPLEDLYLLDSGRRVKRLDIRVYGAPPAGLPFQWALASSPPTALTQAERQEIAAYLTTGLDAWAGQPDEESETSDANVSPRLVVLDRSSGALASH